MSAAASILTEFEIQEFCDELRHFVTAEHEATVHDLYKRWSGSIEERVRKGNAIGNVRVTQVDRRTGRRDVEVVVTCAANDARFREGDCVQITRDEPANPLGKLAKGRIARVTDTSLQVFCDSCRLEVGEDDLTIDADMISLNEFYETAIGKLSATARGRDRIIPLLLDRLPVEGPSLEELSDRRGIPPEFNPSQVEAVIQAAATNLWYLIQGPPGTGKTQVLATLVSRILQRCPNASILVTSFTHRAIDNALASLVKSEIGKDRVFKIAAIPPDDAAIPYCENINAVPKRRDEALIIGATPFALKYRIPDFEFDWVIVDEASQMTLPLAAMAMLAGERWVFFGDHKQMPPVVLSIPVEEAVQKSVFGLLADRGLSTMLNITYRLPPPLACWPAQKFYDELTSAPTIINQRLRLSEIPVGFERALAPDPAAVFVPVEGDSTTTSSTEEVAVAVRLVAALVAAGVSCAEIGIVVPFRRQARHLRSALARSGIPHAKLAHLIADTVERMQGQERDVVIVSLTTSSVDFLADIADFFFQPQRLNVAITRPRRKLIVIGSRKWKDSIPAAIAPAKLICEFLETCAEVQIPR